MDHLFRFATLDLLRSIRFARNARHPTQLAEMEFHLLAPLIHLVLLRNGIFRCQLIKLYFLAYFAYRFITEFISPEIRLRLDLAVYQWAILIFTPAFVGLW